TACGTTPQSFGLAVLRTGTGNGTVTSAPGGITCGATCSASYPSGTSVTLSASPASGSTFTGWSGAGCSTTTCIVAVAATTTVTASLALQPVTFTVSKAGTGDGTITSTPPGIACGATCSSTFPGGTSVSLSANAAPGSTFANWSGGCSGSGGCTVDLNTANTVTATFALQLVSLTVSKAGSGGGTVTSAPAGIVCGTTCSSTFPGGTTLSVSAIADLGSAFTGWGGGVCSGSGSCTFSLAGSTAITATFDSQPVTLSVTTAGTGRGTITSAPSGIACGTTCA